MEGKLNCQICTELYTSDKRKVTNCQKCQFECCLQCLKTHLINNNDAMCMNPDCRAIFSANFIYETFPMNYIKGPLRKHQAEICLEKEKALMNATMPYVESRIRLNRAKEDLEPLLQQQKELNNKINELKHIITTERHFNENEEYEKNMKSTYLKKCPVEGCKGFLNNTYKCTICNQSCCSRCFEIKEEGHICDENNIKTAELLRKDTKSCPKCGEMIHKIEGCNQMYCVKCIFMKTMKIVTGVIHNPHYFEYQQQNNNNTRAIDDIPCGGLPEIGQIKEKLALVYDLSLEKLNTITSLAYRMRNNIMINNIISENKNYSIAKNIYTELSLWMQFASHLRDYEIPPLDSGTNFNKNLEKRIDFMMNKVCEEKFKSSCIKNEGIIMKKNEILQLYITCATLIEDQIRGILTEVIDSHDKINEIINECKQIIMYINNCFGTLAKKFKKNMPQILYPEENNEGPSRRCIVILSNGSKHN